MSLNYKGVITYEDFAISEDEHKEYDGYDTENSDDNDTDTSNDSDSDNNDDDDVDGFVENNLNINGLKINESSSSENKETENKNKLENKNEQPLQNNITNLKEKKERKPRKKIEKSECGICAEVYNISNRKEIKCLFCNYSGCRSCYEQYLLQSNESICMNCKTLWNREFLDNNFTKVFMKGKYKKRREDILMDKQKALLQATIPVAEMRNNASIRLETIHKRRFELCQYIKTLETELRNIDTETYTLRTQLSSKKVNDTQRRHFVKKCPNTECRGFLSTRWKCGLCNTDVCSECHEIKTNEENNQHVCKPENIETAKLIAKDCKNCPKCGTYIYKINGCDQLYCTNCHTAFSWNTGEIETGRIHNPHYFEWLRKNGKQQRELLDIPCGGMPQIYAFRSHVEPYISYNEYEHGNFFNPKRQLVQKNYMPSLYNTVRLVTHIQDVNLRNFQDKIEEIREKEFDLRCDYLMKKIDEIQWKIILQQNECRLEYLTDLSQLYQMFSTVSSEIVLYIYNTTISSQPRNLSADLFIEKMDEIFELIQYFNNNSKKLAKRFNKKNYDCIHNFSIEKLKV